MTLPEHLYRWTRERDALLIAECERGMQYPAILKKLEALPGLPIVFVKRVYARAQYIGARRPRVLRWRGPAA